MNEEGKREVLNLLVQEHIQKAKDKGVLIENPQAFYRHKYQIAEAQANEDPQWLIRQRDRLMGPMRPTLAQKLCPTCGFILNAVTFNVEGIDYCDADCATGKTDHLISLEDYLRRLKTQGPRTFVREDGTESVITYEDAIRFAPRKVVERVEHADEPFV